MSTPPSPNEVTEFSKSSCFQLICIPATQDAGSNPPTEYEVRGRMQVVFLWRASNDFGSQLSTLTGPESYGGLGTTSSTSPHAIFSHMDRFSLRTHNSLSRAHGRVTNANVSSAFISHHWESSHRFFFVMKATPPPSPPPPNCPVIPAIPKCCPLPPSCSINPPDAFYTPASNPTPIVWALGGLGPLPPQSPVLTYGQGSNVTPRSRCLCSLEIEVTQLFLNNLR